MNDLLLMSKYFPFRENLHRQGRQKHFWQCLFPCNCFSFPSVKLSCISAVLSHAVSSWRPWDKIEMAASETCYQYLYIKNNEWTEEDIFGAESVIEIETINMDIMWNRWSLKRRSAGRVVKWTHKSEFKENDNAVEILFSFFFFFGHLYKGDNFSFEAYFELSCTELPLGKTTCTA